MKSRTRTIWLAALLAGAAVAAFMMRAAWAHNPQGEIHSEGEIDWAYWCLIGASWFVSTTLVSGLTMRLLLVQKQKSSS